MYSNLNLNTNTIIGHYLPFLLIDFPPAGKERRGEEDDIDKDFESHSHLQLTFLRAAKHQSFLH